MKDRRKSKRVKCNFPVRIIATAKSFGELEAKLKKMGRGE